MAKYLSEEWLELGRKAINSHKGLAEIARGLNAVFLHTVLDAPGGTMYYWSRFEDGRCTTVELGSVEQADFKLSASYDTWVKIHRGEMGIIRAVLTRRLKMKGSLLKAFRYRKMTGVMSEVIASIPTEY